MREPPRKLDIRTDRDNPDVWNILVFLDGVKQSSCICYDVDKGKLTRHKMKDGRPVLKDNEFETEEVKGVITLQWVDPEKVIG